MIKAYIDASLKPKTTKAGLGILLVKDGMQDPHKVLVHEVRDNHHGEFLALATCLQALKNKGWEKDFVQVFSDSKILVQALDKAYVGQEAYRPILRQILLELKEFPNLYLQWIPEKQNQGADQLARQALKE